MIDIQVIKTLLMFLKVEGDWGYFAPQPGFELVLNRGGYFDQRYSVNICLGWGLLHLNFPFKTKLSEGCDMPRYGIAIHNNTFWLYTGGDYDESMGQVAGNNWVTWDLPFVTWNFDNHQIKDKNNKWRKIEKKESPWEIKEKEALAESYPYHYTLSDGTVQKVTATCTVEKRIWRRKWAYPLTMVRTCIDVAFDEEVGPRRGSYKGGTVGCGYDMLPNETIKDCLKRMENERVFK